MLVSPQLSVPLTTINAELLRTRHTRQKKASVNDKRFTNMYLLLLWNAHKYAGQ